MQWKVDDWLRIASNVAVLIGLILIYLEIQNNTFVTRAELIDSGYLQLNEIQRDLVDDGMASVWIKSMEAPTELTAAERVRLNDRFQRLLLLYTRERVFTSLDVYEEWQGIVRATASVFFGNPYGRAFWAVRRESVNPEIAAAVDSILAESQSSNVYADFDLAIQRELERQQLAD